MGHDGGSSRWFKIAWAVLLAAHVLRIATFFPSPGFLFNTEPILTFDHPFHIYHADLGRMFFREAGTTWGYDTNFFAGYPKSPVWDGSVNMLEHVTIAVDTLFRGAFGLDVPVALIEKWLLVLLVLAVFFLLWHAWKNLGFSPHEALLAQTMALVNLWFQKPVHLLVIGMLGFFTATYVGFWLVSLLVRYLDTRGPDVKPRSVPDRRAAGLLLFLAGPLVLLGHIGGPLPILVPVIILYAAALRRLTWGGHAVLWAVAAWTLLVNAGWWPNFFRFLPMATDTGPLLHSEGVVETFRHQWAAFGFVLGTIRASLRFGFILLAIPGTILWWRRSRSWAALAIGANVLVLFGLVHYGSLIPVLSETQPQRFLPAYALFQIPAVVVLLTELSGWLGRRRSAWEAPARRAILGTSVAGFLALIALSCVRPSSSVWGVPPQARRLVAMLQRECGPDRGPGRILMERQPMDVLPGHLINLLPALVGREFITSPASTPFIRYKTPFYEPCAPFGMPLSAAPSERIFELAEEYGCAWAVVNMRCSLEFFAARTDRAEWAASEGGFTVFRLKQPASLLSRGSGRVQARPNEITLSDLRPENGEVILRYHYLPTLATDPPCKLEEVRVVPEDPVGFIRLVNPAAQVRVYNDYRWRGPLVP